MVRGPGRSGGTMVPARKCRESNNTLGKVLITVLSSKPKDFANEERFTVKPLMQFIANNIEKYPKLMK
jgi:hypothetical protein